MSRSAQAHNHQQEATQPTMTSFDHLTPAETVGRELSARRPAGITAIHVRLFED